MSTVLLCCVLGGRGVEIFWPQATTREGLSNREQWVSIEALIPVSWVLFVRDEKLQFRVGFSRAGMVSGWMQQGDTSGGRGWGRWVRVRGLQGWLVRPKKKPLVSGGLKGVLQQGDRRQKATFNGWANRREDSFWWRWCQRVIQFAWFLSGGMFCAEADDSPLEVKYFLNTCRTLKEEPALASFNGL